MHVIDNIMVLNLIINFIGFEYESVCPCGFLMCALSLKMPLNITLKQGLILCLRVSF